MHSSTLCNLHPVHLFLFLGLVMDINSLLIKYGLYNIEVHVMFLYALRTFLKICRPSHIGLAVTELSIGLAFGEKYAVIGLLFFEI